MCELHSAQIESLVKIANPVARTLLQSRVGIIYFIGERGQDVVKIGRTLHDSAKKRLESMQVGNHRELYVIAQIIGPYDLENFLHRVFKSEWIRGEWFKISPEIEKLIDVARAGDSLKFVETIITYRP